MYLINLDQSRRYSNSSLVIGDHFHDSHHEFSFVRMTSQNHKRSLLLSCDNVLKDYEEKYRSALGESVMYLSELSVTGLTAQT